MEIKLTKKEFDVLWSIEEGMNNLKGAEVFTGYGKKELKKIFEKLSKLGLIDLTKKFDEYYKEDYWYAYIIKEKTKELYEKYKEWIPKD